MKGLNDFRIPDISVVLSGSKAHLEGNYIAGGPDFIIEIRSPDDETYEKIGWYAKQGVRDLVVINRDTKHVEHYKLSQGELVLQASSPHAAIYSIVPIIIKTVYEPKGNKIEVRHRHETQR